MKRNTKSRSPLGLRELKPVVGTDTPSRGCRSPLGLRELKLLRLGIQRAIDGSQPAWAA